MRLINKLTNIETFSLNGKGRLLFVNTDNSLVDYQTGKKHVFDRKIGMIGMDYSDNFWVSYPYQEVSPLGLLGNFQEFEYDEIAYRIFEIKNGDNFARANFKTMKLDEDGKLLWIKELYFVKYIMDSGCIYYLDGHLAPNVKTLTTLSDQTGELLWSWQVDSRFDYAYPDHRGVIISGSAKIEKLLGVCDGIFWFTLSTGVIMGLAAESGEELYVLRHNPLPYDMYLGKDGYIDFLNKLIFGLGHTRYYEINLRDPEKDIQVFDIKESMTANHFPGSIHIHENCLTENFIFFRTHNYFSMEEQYVGIFDRHKREVIWNSSSLESGGYFNGIKKLEYSQGKLYVLDKHAVLHIFDCSEYMTYPPQNTLPDA